MSDKFKIQFRWQTTTYDGGPAKEKRQIALASGDYPDLFFLIPWVDAFTQAEVLKLGSQGVAVPLEDLIKDNAPNIQKVLDSNKTYKEMSTAPDGHIYALPQWADCYHCTYPDKLWINSTWLKKLGLQVAEDDRGPAQRARGVQDQGPERQRQGRRDPDDDRPAGQQPDRVPDERVRLRPGRRATTASARSLTLNGDKVVTPVTSPQWKEGLKYIASLYKEGLIDQAAFTQNAQALQAQGNNPKAVMLGSVPVLWPGIFVQLGLEGRPGQAVRRGAAADRSGGQELHRVQPPDLHRLHVHADQQGQQGGPGRRDQDAGLHLHRRGPEITTMGPEGVGWTKPAPVTSRSTRALKPMYKPVQDAPKNINWGAMAQYNNTLAYRNAQVVPKDIYTGAGLERRLFQATKQYEGHEDKSQWFPQTSVWPDPSLSGELATLQTNLNSYVNQNQLAFITGSKNIDTGWDAYVKGLDSTGMTAVPGDPAAGLRQVQVRQQVAASLRPPPPRSRRGATVLAPRRSRAYLRQPGLVCPCPRTVVPYSGRRLVRGVADGQRSPRRQGVRPGRRRADRAQPRRRLVRRRSAQARGDGWSGRAGRRTAVVAGGR